MVYHSQEGQTDRISQRMAGHLQAHGLEVDVASVEDPPAGLAGYDAIVTGGPLHMGHHSKELLSFIRQHRDELDAARISAFFSVSLAIASVNEEERIEVHRIAQDFLAEAGWEPDLTAFFGGRLAYTRYGFIMKRMMRRIAAKEGGSTDMSHDTEMTDWDAVAEFSNHIAEAVSAPSA